MLAVGPRKRKRRCCRLAAADAQINSLGRYPEPIVPVHDWLEVATLHPELDQDIEEFLADIPAPNDGDIGDAIGRVQECARGCVAPSALAMPFGSSVNGFGNSSSDLDLLVAVDKRELSFLMDYAKWVQSGQTCFATNPRQVTQRGISSAVLLLAESLPSFGFEVARSLPTARKPIVTVKDLGGVLDECDVSVNNCLPLGNTKLLRDYSRLDKRARPLVLLVKAWAKKHKVLGAYHGNLSSYSWTIMTIYFLQLVACLPSLQALRRHEASITEVDFWGRERTFDVSFMSADEYLEKHPTTGSDGLSLASLLFGFFRFYSLEYRWGEEVVSIKLPDRREADPWWRLHSKPQPEPGISIEDPIEERDLNIVLKAFGLERMKAKLQAASATLEGGGSFKTLFTASDSARSIPSRAARHRSKRLTNRRRLRSLMSRV